jgi:hypothetical protein
MRKSVCPETFPEVCDQMPRGVGLIFDYTRDAKPVRIPAGGTHPAFIARFLRILYLSGIGTTENSINYEAHQAIDLHEIQGDSGTWTSLKACNQRSAGPVNCGETSGRCRPESVIPASLF